MGSFSLFIDALSDPEAFFRTASLRDRQPVPALSGLWAFLLGVLSLVLAFVLLGKGGTEAFSRFSVALVFLLLLSLLFKGALLHFFASVWGTRGRAEVLVRALPWTYLPFLFLLPSALVLRSVGMEGFYPLVFLAVLGYSYFMEVGVLKAVYGLKTGRAVLVFLLPIAFQLVFLFVFVLGLLSAVVGLLLGGSGLV